MKMYLGNTAVNSMKVGTNTDDATFVASDLQAGKTGYSMGRKVTGTGKCFEFANYGALETNIPDYIPSLINVVEITSLDCPIKSSIAFRDMKNVDFSTERIVGSALVDNVEYPITVKINGNIITFTCEKTITLQSFYGKDNYI